MLSNSIPSFLFLLTEIIYFQVLGIKDEDQKFDMIVRNCVAHDGKRTPIQLVNEMGCVIRPKIMSKFNKIKNFGSSASVVSYAYFQVLPQNYNYRIYLRSYNLPKKTII